MSFRTRVHAFALILIAAAVAACRAAAIAPQAAGDASGTAGAAPPTAHASEQAPAQGEPAPADGPAARAASNQSVHGFFSTRYRAQTGAGADDHDLDNVLSLDFGDAERDRISGHFMGRANLDFDGSTISDPFYSLNDTFDDGLAAHLYDAWVDVRPTGKDAPTIERWRLGRQLDYFTPEFAWFDGLSVQTRAEGKQQRQFGLYGGVPVHLYESSPSGDAIFGAFVAGNPWKDAHLRADWMHLEDETRLADHRDDLFALDAAQVVSRNLRLEGRYTQLQEDPRDVRAQLSWSDAPRGLTLFVSYYELLRTQGSLALEVDPFYTTLLDQFPYRQARVLVSKAVDSWLIVQGGADLRRMSNEADIGQFNREFERGFLTATAADLLPLKLSLSGTGELWHSPDTELETWGAELSRPFGQRFEGSLGSYYSLFKYDLFSVQERDDVRTYYLALKWEQSDSSVFDARYEFEDNDFGDFQSLRLGATWRF